MLLRSGLTGMSPVLPLQKQLVAMFGLPDMGKVCAETALPNYLEHVRRRYRLHRPLCEYASKDTPQLCGAVSTCSAAPGLSRWKH